MVQIKLKDKYTSPKPATRYKSSHNDSNKKIKRNAHVGPVVKPVAERVLVVEAGTGKRKWGWQ